MKSNFILLKTAIKNSFYVLAFLPVVTLAYPAVIAQAAGLQSEGQTSDLVFEISPNQNKDTQVTNEILEIDPLVINLKTYLEKHNSPLAQYAEEIVKQPQWQRALAISWGESNFGRKCANNNCSGIGGAPGRKTWRVYPNKLEWFKDMSKLLEKPIYKERFINCKTMNGVYNAGSNNWLRACEKKSNELISLTNQSYQQRMAFLDAPKNTELALAIK